MSEMITPDQIESRKYWIKEIIKLSGNFGDDSDKIEQEISDEIERKGINCLFGHLRLCGAIPEEYGHDSSEEKLYSKYTDVITAKSFESMGITSAVIKERADTADVECISKQYSFVADAKAFRLSRTAKNQKDFKVQAMDNWKRDKSYALLVCPIYQLPSKNSQIYEQAATRSVCIFSYTHLAVLVRYALSNSQTKSIDLLHEIFKTVEALNPTKDATAYWQAINRIMINYDSPLRTMWLEEKKASSESIMFAKQKALTYLASERTRIMQLSREDAIRDLLRSSNVDNKIKAVRSVSDNGLLSVW